MDGDDGLAQSTQQRDSQPKIRNKSASKAKKYKQKKGLIVDLRKTHYKVLKDVVQTYLNWRVLKQDTDQEPNIIWTDFYVTEDEVNDLQPFQKINHFPSSFQLGNKAFLTKNISKMKKKFADEYSFLPQSWQLPEELQLFKYQKQKKKGSTWILKPANQCQGKGIVISNNFEMIQERVRQSRRQYVVQKYIENPYLVNDLKFDLRLYVLVRSLKPLQIYLYKDGLARFATNNYKKPSKANLSNNYMHLTNYAINKKNPAFCEEEETGHKRKLSSLLETLINDGKDINPLMAKICKAIVCTIISAQPMLSHLYMTSAPSKFAKGKNCFEVFGFDFLVDQELDPYLLEVNHTPSFRVSSQVDRDIKCNLLKDTLLQLYSRDQNTQIYKEPFEWNIANSLAYLQIYPTNNQSDPFSEIIQHSQFLFDFWTGVNKKAIRSQAPSPDPKASFSEKKVHNYGLRINTADSETASNLVKRQLRKTMTTLEKPTNAQTLKMAPNPTAPSRYQRAVSAAKKHSLNSTKMNIQLQKKSACVIYDFMERNIDLDDFEHTNKESYSAKQTKRILLKSFNSKYYKNSRPRRFHETYQRAEQ